MTSQRLAFITVVGDSMQMYRSPLVPPSFLQWTDPNNHHRGCHRSNPFGDVRVTVVRQEFYDGQDSLSAMPGNIQSVFLEIGIIS